MVKSIIRLGAVCVLLASAAAHADTIVWKDPVHAFTMSYPDSWTIQTDDTANTRLRVAGPLAGDLPTCRMKVVADGRAKIYPKGIVDEAVFETLNADFWQTEAAQYESSQVTAFFAPASMGGKGDATAVRVTFVQDDGQEKVPMHGVMIGSIYGDKRFVASCSSKAEVYDRWAPVFASILGSVELDSRYHPFASGYYRNFLRDPKLVLPRSKPGVDHENEGNFFATIGAGKYHR